MPRNETRLGGTEIERPLSDILSASNGGEYIPKYVAFVPDRIAGVFCSHLIGRYGPRGNGIDADAVTAQVEGHLLGEVNERGLGRFIGRVPGAHLESRAPRRG